MNDRPTFIQMKAVCTFMRQPIGIGSAYPGSKARGEVHESSATRPCALHASPLAFYAWIYQAQKMEKEKEK